MGDSASPPFHLGFAVESVKQPMEIEASGLTDTLANERGKKRPPSPLSGDDDDDSSISEDDDGDWLSSGSEEDKDDENNGTYSPFTVDDIPRPDFKEQWDMVFQNPDARRRGPLPIQLSPPFISSKCGYHLNYNLIDESKSMCNDGDCSNQCRCRCMNLFQFIDVKIAGYRHSHSAGCARIFGFIAAQGTVDPVGKYVYKREIRNCEPVSLKQKTGVARLAITSPTRVIQIRNRAFIEFELHALGEDEKGDDNLIIEGCTEIYNMESKSFVEQRRLYSVKCALDIKFAVLLHAVEAQVYIEVLRVPSQGVDLKLCAKTSGFSDIIRLFQGAALEVGFTKRFTIAVVMKNSLELYIKGSRSDDYALSQKLLQGSWRHSFISDLHGTVESLAELGDFAEISVKVTWKSYRRASTSLVS